MVLADSGYVEANGLKPLAVVKAWASSGVAPGDTGLGPKYTIPKALGRAGLEVGDVDLWEINEAFASMCVASTRILGIPHEITNVNGSGCSIGHPVAATGGNDRHPGPRAAPARWRHRCREHVRGGGMGSATVLEVMPA